MRWWNWILKGLFLLALCGVVFGGAAWFGYQLLVKPHQLPPEELAGGKPVLPPDPSLPDFEKAMKIKAAHQPVEAREALERFLETYPFSTKLAEARKALGEVNTDIFLSAIPAPNKIRYEIRSGDNLERIKRKLKTTDELIMRCNNLDDPRRLRIGQVLWVSQPAFSVLIDRKTHTVLLLDTDAPDHKAETMGVLVDWPGEAAWPVKFVFLASESHPPSCAVATLAAERVERQREELNALYVALTRARANLVLSSIEPHRRTGRSWWQRLLETELVPRLGIDVAAVSAGSGSGSGGADLEIRTLPSAPPGQSSSPFVAELESRERRIGKATI